MADANAVAQNLAGGTSTTCEKKVQNAADLVHWQRSRAYHDLISYINATSAALQGIKNTDEIHESNVVRELLQLFITLEAFVEQHPPLEQPQRFGNKAYRDWARQMRDDMPQLLAQALPSHKHKFLNELQQYLIESFGNATRIDYGTGHELSFLFFLCGLFKAEILLEEDIVGAALRLFNRYLEFVRQLQRTYNMEPAGSQGVWSLDDYQFVPFIWGSAQLAVRSPFEPSKFVEEQIINDYKSQYMFISCIDHICKVKTGHFGEHSNQLWSITAVPSWAKINTGLVKMYQKEILCKFPVIQHVYFGELMSFDPVSAGAPLSNARFGNLVPTPAKRVCKAVPVTTLLPPSPVAVPPPPAEVLSNDLNIGDSSSESSDNSVVLRPRMGSPASHVATEGSTAHSDKMVGQLDSCEAAEQQVD